MREREDNWLYHSSKVIFEQFVEALNPEDDSSIAAPLDWIEKFNDEVSNSLQLLYHSLYLIHHPHFYYRLLSFTQLHATSNPETRTFLKLNCEYSFRVSPD